MQPQLWERVKSIFNDALAVDPDARATLVEQASHGDAELRRHVMSLLAAHDDATEFLETPAVALIGEPPPLRDFSPPARDRIGPYRLLHEIGRGGMGAVFLATRDDGQFAQRVAVKLIKRGMDTDDIVARFRRERQIVAALEHPNIARLLDGGSTDDGVPYFVMEYVEGQSIQEYCRVRKLDVRQRLQLFRSVCDAVQFAHRNLVVHRDI
ncbi:MAG: protein kinase domain-containing protein, partial [Gemmatimonas sp.]